MMQTASVQRAYATVTEIFIHHLERGTVPWRLPWSGYGPPTNAVTKVPYRGVNLWLLNTVPYDENYFLTAEEAEAHGSPIQPWQRGYPIIRGDDILAGKEDIAIETVYNVIQCRELPGHFAPSRKIILDTSADACFVFSKVMRNRPGMKLNSDYTGYNVEEDVAHVHFAEKVPAEVLFQTLVHLYIHGTGHPKRLNRASLSGMAETSGDHFSYEELVAEIGTGYLCALFQIAKELPMPPLAYIEGWIKRLRQDETMIVHASADAQRAVELLLEGHPVANMMGLP